MLRHQLIDGVDLEPRYGDEWHAISSPNFRQRRQQIYFLKKNEKKGTRVGLTRSSVFPVTTPTWPPVAGKEEKNSDTKKTHPLSLASIANPVQPGNYPQNPNGNPLHALPNPTKPKNIRSNAVKLGRTQYKPVKLIKTQLNPVKPNKNLVLPSETQ